VSRLRPLLARLGLLGGGLLVGLLLTEIGLRLLGLLLSPPAPPEPEAGGARVLCVGDSFVYGLGSEDRRGFPEHLQDLLSPRGASGGAAVFNRGVPGYNSSQAANAFENELDAIRPSLVILLVGHNNGWNFNDLHLEGLDAGPLFRAMRALGGLRSVRLLQLVRRWERPHLASVPQEGGRRDPETEAWLRSQDRALKAEKFAREKASLEAALTRSPDDVWAMVGLAKLAEAEGARDASDAWMAKARATDAAEVERVLEGLGRVDGWHEAQRARGGDTYLERRDADLVKLRNAVGRGRDLSSRIERQRLLLDEVLRRDLLYMAGLARGRGARVVVSGYPNDKHANLVLDATAREMDAPFVDQRADFDTRLAAGTPPGRLFVLDGHCTSEGYRRMAENLAPWIRTGETGL
jgi:lysophospholipase L1-like esterase